MTGLLGPAEIRELAARLGVAPDQEARPELRARPEHRAPDRHRRRARPPTTWCWRSAPGSARSPSALLPVAGARARRGDRPGAGRRAAGDRRRGTPARRRPADRAPRRRAADRRRRAGRPAADRAGGQPALQRGRAGGAAPARRAADACGTAWSWCRRRSPTGSPPAPAPRCTASRRVKLAWYADARAGRQGAAERVLAGAQRRLRPGRVHPPRAARAPTYPGERVFAVVDAAFAQRRKTLRAALAGWAGGADRAAAASSPRPGSTPAPAASR